MSQTTLFCTVGGSHQVILRTIRHHEPDRIVFVCSEDEPERAGTYELITGDGMVCKSDWSSPPDLPNIPTQIGLSEDVYDAPLRVPADSPEVVIDRVLPMLDEAASKGPVIADYTGGTKSMSSGLFFAAVISGAQLSLVNGTRVDHVRVMEGTEAVAYQDVSAIRDSQYLRRARNAWKRFEYQRAAKVLDESGSDHPDIKRLRVLSRAFAAWDNFDHQQAYRLLRTCSRDVPDLLPVIATLKKPEERWDRSAEAYNIWDLRKMAERRAATDRYDTALLLLYRVFEWIGRWTLNCDHDIDTSDVSESIAEQYSDLVHRAPNDSFKLGMEGAWRLIERLDGALADIAEETRHSRRTIAQRRNQSVLTHGTTPVTKKEYDQARIWFEEEVESRFVEAAFGSEPPFDQLPSTVPNGLMSSAAGDE